MGHARRKFDHSKLYMVTDRLSEGLPLVPNDFINELIHGALARAAALHSDIATCAFIWMQNHYHLLVVTEGDPQALSDFLHDLNDEVAKMVARITGKRNAKIWAQRPHVMLIGDYLAAIREFAYCYINPVAANFCAKASEWAGVNGYRYLFDATPVRYKWTPTSRICKLPNKAFTKKQIRHLCTDLEKKPRKVYEFTVKPFVWKQCFSETKELPDEAVRELILAKVAEGEEEYALKRKKENQKLANPNHLRCQNPHKRFQPARNGRRVYCICTDLELRKQLLAEYQCFCEECRAVWAAWKDGDFSLSYPPAAFIPPQKPIANCIT